MEARSIIKVFYCYDHADQILRDELEKHLSPLRRLRYITGWFDRHVLAGTDFERETEKQLDAAHIILLLVSPDFLASNSCYEIEMQRALERHKVGKAHVIPIILRPVYWEETPIGALQALPAGGKPITQWLNHDEAMLDVARGIRNLVKELLSKETLSQQETTALEQVGRAVSGKEGLSLNQGEVVPHAISVARLPPPDKESNRLLPSPQNPSIIRGTNDFHPIKEDVHPLATLKRSGMETGRVIHRRYLLQYLIERGIVCTVYQGTDQVLQRNVAVKVVPAEHIPAYRAAIRATAQFAHPNITGLFDLIVEPENLYIVQEQIKGDDFSSILRSSPTPSQVCDMGIQICQALIYAAASHKMCHGDLTPSAIIRDLEGHIRINNFALPSNIEYFVAWGIVGGGGFVLSDPELPYGQMSEGRRGDDTRAVGILLYQLLTGRPADATRVEPPPDRRLRFQRNVPAELCEVIARAIVRIHPQRILTAESLYSELEQIAEGLEPV